MVHAIEIPQKAHNLIIGCRSWFHVITCYAINAVLVTDCISSICILISAPTVVAALVRNAGYLIVVFYVLLLLKEEANYESIIFILSTAVSIVVSEIITGTSDSGMMETYIYQIIRVIPVFVLSTYAEDTEKLLRGFRPYIVIAVIYGTVNTVAFGEASSNYMTFSYNLLIPTVIAFYFFVRNRQPIYLVLFIYLMVLILVLGARGPLGCAIFACLLLWLQSNKEKTAKLLFMLVICVTVFMVLIAFTHQILLVLSSRFPDSRTVQLLINTSSMDMFLTGRRELFDATERLISRNLFLGYGIFSSNYFLSVELGYSGYSVGIYPHNIVLDAFLQFGVVLGTALLCGMIMLILRSTKLAADIDQFSLALLLIFISRNITLMVSGTYISDPYFWFLIGYCINIVRKHAAIKRMIIWRGR